jgi:cytochrome o ubiquinol oxidase subunit II
MFSFNFALLNPKGLIAAEQRDLIIIVVSMMLIAVVPILTMAYVFAWKYRANRKQKYTPSFDRSLPLQLSWLGLLLIIITTFAILAWRTSHSLDPRKPLQSDVQPINIQVVALEWKWLFIYPDLGIATVNLMPIPEDTPINFQITADAPMNSFWIPQLGGQMYAMNGMKTTLHLMATDVGNYKWYSSNISGEGFAGMNFDVEVDSSSDFNIWVNSAKQSSEKLTSVNYGELAQPTMKHPHVTYATVEENLFNSIMMKYMTNSKEMEHRH